MRRITLPVLIAAVFMLTPRVTLFAQDKQDSPGQQFLISVGEQVLKVGYQSLRSYLQHHPCAQWQDGPDGKKFCDVALISSAESRGSINFSIEPFKAADTDHDNGDIKVEFVNFGHFADVAVVQTKVDKSASWDHSGIDRDRGSPLRNGGTTEIGIGPDGANGFYFAIRGEKWNTQQLLSESPNAYIKVTLLQHPASRVNK